MDEKQKPRTINPFLRTIIEVGFIVFLFYSNLLMGEYTNSGMGKSHGIIWAIQDIFTPTNFIIAIVSGLVGQVVFEFLRKKL